MQVTSGAAKVGDYSGRVEGLELLNGLARIGLVVLDDQFDRDLGAAHIYATSGVDVSNRKLVCRLDLRAQRGIGAGQRNHRADPRCVAGSGSVEAVVSVEGAAVVPGVAVVPGPAVVTGPAVVVAGSSLPQPVAIAPREAIKAAAITKTRISRARVAKDLSLVLPISESPDC